MEITDVYLYPHSLACLCASVKSTAPVAFPDLCPFSAIAPTWRARYCQCYLPLGSSLYIADLFGYSGTLLIEKSAENTVEYKTGSYSVSYY